MSPPNEESGVNSATEVIGADVEIFVAVVFCVTVTVPRLAFGRRRGRREGCDRGKERNVGGQKAALLQRKGGFQLNSSTPLRWATHSRSGWLRHSIISYRWTRPS